MDLHIDYDIAEGYTSNVQKARVITEAWMHKNMYCPVCGRAHLAQFTANKPVADFYCESCKQEFELKSKHGKSLGPRIADGAYSTMMERVTSNNNPNLFFMSHKDCSVNNLILIPRFFFTPGIIEVRKPLSGEARRAGWVGCNIHIEAVPQPCKIEIISSGKVNDPETVVAAYNKIRLLQVDNMESRGWMLDVLFCVGQIPTETFRLEEVYRFAPMLAEKHPSNNHIQAKIRQQLQYLRDKGYIEFLSRGVYRRTPVL
jgi:type II restriction enzyme